ncbi:MAG: hypothetical protein ACRD9R_18180, partial [Pyrinomonadaceae bacterium]
TDGVIAEHLSDLQFRYALNLRDANGNIQQPVPRLTQAQLDKVRQVEVTVTAETAHNVLHGGEQSTNDNTQNDDTVSSDGKRARVTMTSSTSIRNMQFREALQPTSGS